MEIEKIDKDVKNENLESKNNEDNKNDNKKCENMILEVDDGKKEIEKIKNEKKEKIELEEKNEEGKIFEVKNKKEEGMIIEKKEKLYLKNIEVINLQKEIKHKKESQIIEILELPKNIETPFTKAKDNNREKMKPNKKEKKEEKKISKKEDNKKMIIEEEIDSKKKQKKKKLKTKSQKKLKKKKKKKNSKKTKKIIKKKKELIKYLKPKKIENLNILLLGITPIGLEISKNLILSKIKSLKIWDNKLIKKEDNEFNFFSTENSEGKKKSENIRKNLEDLNPYKNFEILENENLEEILKKEFLKNFDLVVICDFYKLDKIEILNKLLKELNKGLIVSGTIGLLGFNFSDFSEKHNIYNSKKKFKKYKIISLKKNGILEVKNKKKSFDIKKGDFVKIKGTSKKFIDGVYKVENIFGNNSLELKIENEEDVFFKKKITLKKIDLKEKNECMGFKQFLFSNNLKKVNFDENIFMMKIILRVFWNYVENKGFPDFYNFQELTIFKEKLKIELENDLKKMDELSEKYLNFLNENTLKLFFSLSKGNYAPISSFFGGLTTIKILNHFEPNQKINFYINEFYTSIFKDYNFEDFLKNRDEIKKNKKNIAQIALLGNEIQEKIQNSNILLVGSDILASEYVKMLSKMGFCENEKSNLIISDNDLIQNYISNPKFLQNQNTKGTSKALNLSKKALEFNKFLKIKVCEYVKMLSKMGFCENEKSNLIISDNDLIQNYISNPKFLQNQNTKGTSKALNLSKKALEFNKFLKIKVFKQKVNYENENIFTDEIWDSLDLVINTSNDNETKSYLKTKSVFHLKNYYDSLVQENECETHILKPLQNCYKKRIKSKIISNDKFFPYKMEHCVKWAINIFKEIFETNSLLFSNYFKNNEKTKNFMENLSDKYLYSRYKLRDLNNFVKIFENPYLESYVKFGIKIYQRYFDQEISELLILFPCDLIEDNYLFWNSPNRPPITLPFKKSNMNHQNFIIVFVKILNQIFPLQETANKEKILECLKKIKISRKKILIKNQDKNTLKIENKEKLSLIFEKLKEITEKYKKIHIKNIKLNLKSEKTSHLDIITLLSNIKAYNYSINMVSKKQINNIIQYIQPSFNPLNSIVCGINGIEIYKQFLNSKNEKINKMYYNKSKSEIEFSNLKEKSLKNEFFDYKNNLIEKIPNNLNKWSKIEIQGPLKLEDLFLKIKEKYGILVNSIVTGNIQVWTKYSNRDNFRLKMMIEHILENFGIEKYKGKKYQVFFVSGVNEKNQYIESPILKYTLG